MQKYEEKKISFPLFFFLPRSTVFPFHYSTVDIFLEFRSLQVYRATQIAFEVAQHRYDFISSQQRPLILQS